MINEQDFISFLEIKKGSPDQTIRHCKFRVRVINKWLSENNKDLSSQSVEEFLAYIKRKGRGNAAINTYLFCFRRLQDYYTDRGRTERFIDGFKSLPKVALKEITIFSQLEVETLLVGHVEFKPFRGKDTSHMDTVYGTFTMGLAYTAARFGELSSITIENLHLNISKIHLPANITKTKEPRNLYITEPLLSKLRFLIKDKSPKDLVFTNMMGNKITPQEYQKYLDKLAENTGVTSHVNPHKFRHTYATHLYIATRDIGLVQLVLGHKNITSTQIYVHIADEIIRSGMYTHPFVRLNIPISETIKYIESHLAGLRLEDDPRFDVVKIKNVLNGLVTGLYGAVR